MPGPGFDTDRATEAWLAILSPEQRAMSDAYFEGELLGGIPRRALCDRRHGDPARHRCQPKTARSCRPREPPPMVQRRALRGRIYRARVGVAASVHDLHGLLPRARLRAVDAGVCAMDGRAVHRACGFPRHRPGRDLRPLRGDPPRRSALVDLGDGIRIRVHAPHRHDLPRVHRPAVQRLQAAGRRRDSRRRAVAGARQRNSDRARRMVRRIAPDDADQRARRGPRRSGADQPQ